MSEFVGNAKITQHALEVSRSLQNVEVEHCAPGEDECANSFVSIGSCSWVLVQVLTPSLPSSHLKSTNKSAKFETKRLFVFFFLYWHVEGFSSKRIALKVDVVGPENVPFACTSLHLTGWGSEEVNNQRTMLARVECCHAWSDWPDNLSFSLQGPSQPHRQRKDPSRPQSVESRGYALSVL